MPSNRLNEQILNCLRDWHNEAIARNSKSKFTLKKAIQSVERCQTDIVTPDDALSLDGIGRGTVSRLHQLLTAPPERDTILLEQVQRELASHSRSESDSVAPSEGRAPGSRSYVPNYRSGAFAILCYLTLKNRETLLPQSKQEIIQGAQQFCDSSFTIPQRMHMTAWSAISTLLKRALVQKTAGRRFELTEEGIALGGRLVSSLSSTVQSPPQPDVVSQPVTVRPFENPIECVPAGHSRVVCAVDNRERCGALDRSVLLSELLNLGVDAISCTLEVGDFLWLAKTPNGQSIVLDVIVERKRHDDFVSSIATDRFKEQLLRLSNCLVPTVIYVLEEHSNPNVFEEFGSARVTSALCDISLRSNFLVHYTSSFRETLNFVKQITLLLGRQLQSEPLYYATATIKSADEFLNVSKDYDSLLLRPLFELFQSVSSKSENTSLGDVFLQQLLRVRGITVSKALAIAQHFNTAASLIDALSNCSSTSDRDSLIWKLTNGLVDKKASCRVACIFCD